MSAPRRLIGFLSPTLPAPARALRAFVAVVLAAVFSGCAEAPLEYTEVTRLHEPVKDSEAEAFLNVIDALPDRRMPAMNAIFGPPPDWNESRTLPVNDLVREEQARLAERWDVDRLAAEWEGNRALHRALRKQRMTVQQFAGFTLTLGAALSRAGVRENQPLPQLREKGIAEVAQLNEDGRSFASLPEDMRHQVLQRAIWITRLDRTQRLLHVPPENVDLAHRLESRFREIFPEEFTSNPFDGISDLLEEKGLPFLETSAGGYDDELDWNREDAIIGHDTPDMP